MIIMKKSVTKNQKIRSMTGFGQSSVRSPYGTINTEIKTLNHKSLSITCGAFNGFFFIEERIKSLIEPEIMRGKVFVNITKEDNIKRTYVPKAKINENAAKEYLRQITKMQKQLGVKGEVRIQDLLMFPGVIEQNTDEKDEEKVWPYIKKASEEALAKLMKYREEEGAKLAEDLLMRVKKIQGAVNDIKKHAKESVEGYRKKLSTMIKTATDKEELDRTKLEDEVALFARNCDITEEITRLEHHTASCRNILERERNEAGKKMDFIAQEMHRETNTIGSKSSDYRISSAVIEIKSEIEKIREQLRNIE